MVRALLALALAIALAIAAAASAMQFTLDDIATEEAFSALYKRWCARYGPVRAGPRDSNEEAARFVIFKENALRRVDKFKSKQSDILGINLFGDLTRDELKDVCRCNLIPLSDDYNGRKRQGHDGGTTTTQISLSNFGGEDEKNRKEIKGERE